MRLPSWFRGVVETRKERAAWLGGTFLAAVLFRAFLFFSGVIDAVFETWDSWEYHDLGMSILKHHVFGLDGVPKMNRTPGYPAFLAFLYGTVGQSQAAVTSSQVCIEVLSWVMAVDIVLRAKLGRLAALVVAVLGVTCAFSAACSFGVMTETFHQFVLTLSVWVLPVGGIAAFARKSNLWRVFAGGALAGWSTLVRPASAMTIMAMLAFVALAFVPILRRRRLFVRPLTSLVAFGVGATLVVAPWMARNRIVFHEDFEHPDWRQPTMLGYKTDINTYRHWYTDEFMYFRRSYEEPMVFEGAQKAPSIARYVYPGEREEVEETFALIQHEMTLSETAPISKPTMARLREIGRKRYAAAPRLYLTAPTSRIARFWIAPRVAVLWGHGKHGGNVSGALTAGLTLYNCVYVLPGLLGLLFPLRGSMSRWVGIVALLVSQTMFYAFWHAAPQSRYTVPFLPLACVGAGVFVARFLLQEKRSKRRRRWLGWLRPRRT
jgi:hypothetical protein